MDKVIVSASGQNLEAEVAPRFGRAPYFLLVNPATMEYEAVANRQNLQAVQGAGIQSAALVARYKPSALLTGYCGPKAFHTLEAAGIEVIVGVEGSVREAVQQFRSGKLSPAGGPNAEAHW
jgi:predicted Fe-Mo cluster-binding NifX family protein